MTSRRTWKGMTDVDEEIKALGAVAAAILSIVGVFKAVGGARNWISGKLKERRERKAAPVRALMAQIQDQGTTLEKISSRLDTMDETDRSVSKQLAQIEAKVNRMEEGVATLQGDRLNQAFEYYVEDGNPCPMATKQSLAAMHKQYTSGGHNHLHDSYMERLERCPTK